MTYVALLRGINVGGNNKVEMAKLKITFEELGLKNVKTLIASGNVIFRSDSKNKENLSKLLEAAIEKDFGISIRVLLRTLPEIDKVAKAIPSAWTNNADMKCDVMFLWEEIDTPSVIKELNANPDFEDVIYKPGAIIWRINREHVTKSKMLKIIGTKLYKEMTVRNVNTVRKLLELMRAVK